MTFKFRELEHFRTGGTGDEMILSIPLPRSPSGKVYQCCPTSDCVPALFQLGEVKTQQEISQSNSNLIRRLPRTEGVTCPYCGHDAPDQEFISQEDIEAAIELVKYAAMQDVVGHFGGVAREFNRQMKNAGDDFLSIRMDVQTPRKQPPIAAREDLLRDLTCDICVRPYGVYAIALFCPDCGARNLHVHFRREVEIVRQQIELAKREEQDNKQELAYRLLGNAHEDVLTALETYLKTVYRFLVKRRLPDEAEKLCAKKAIGNRFQNIERGQELFAKIGVDPYEVLAENDLNFLRLNIEKRHVLGHNLGIADEAYAEVAQAEQLGQTVQLIAEEILRFAEICNDVILRLGDGVAEFYPPTAANPS